MGSLMLEVSPHVFDERGHGCGAVRVLEYEIGNIHDL